MITDCIILAAGLGTRMRPLTNDIPKPMVNVASKPLIAYVLEMCIEAGIENIVMNIHYKPEPLISFISEHYPHKVTFSDETSLLLESGGGIVQALTSVKGNHFFVINADCIWHNLTHNALKQLSEAYNKEKFDVFKLLASSENAIGFDEQPIYALDRNGHILKDNLNKKFSYTGIQILERKLFDTYNCSPFSIKKIWDKTFSEQRVGGVEFIGKWLHIGTPQGVIDAENFLSHL